MTGTSITIIKRIKQEIRVLGWDDGPFEQHHPDDNPATVPVIGVVCRGGSFIDGVLRTDVTVDGFDATGKLVEAVNRSRHKGQVRILMLKLSVICVRL